MNANFHIEEYCSSTPTYAVLTNEDLKNYYTTDFYSPESEKGYNDEDYYNTNKIIDIYSPESEVEKGYNE